MIAKIILIGHVGKDPEIKTDKTTFSVAIKLGIDVLSFLKKGDSSDRV